MLVHQNKSYCLLFRPLALLPVDLGRIQLHSAEDCNLQREAGTGESVGIAMAYAIDLKLPQRNLDSI